MEYFKVCINVHYGNKFYRYDFKSYSLIKDEVVCERVILKCNQENGDTTVDNSREEKTHIRIVNGSIFRNKFSDK